ncbi:MAG: DUF1848 domain-containing protein [Clostridiales bacterium]|nr:DUF1848 domain-containing protein [Clostridiales bacterium]
MIISASRRTDLPAFYADWLVKRFQEGYALVRNPMNYHQVSKILLTPEKVDGIVFWTKNPMPLLPHLHAFDAYPFYFQYTLTSYGKEMEPGIPEKGRRGIAAFRQLSERVGKERVIWRYDPILLSQRYSPEYHIRYFEQIARRLEGYTEKCIFSFLDLYPSIQKRMDESGVLPMEQEQMQKLAGRMAEIASAYHLKLETCAEPVQLSEFGIGQGSCIDAALLSRIAGKPIRAKKDKNQRAECGCAASVDIGAYGACYGGCQYCYARRDGRAKQHRADSPFLLGVLEEGDIVCERE